MRNKRLVLQKLIDYIPGILLAIIIIVFSTYFANLFGQFLIELNILPSESSSPISAIFIAILFGIIIRNTIGINNYFRAGIQFTLKYFLRAGIILLGLKLSLVEALKLGAWGLPLIIICISVGLTVTLFFTKKMKQSHRLGTLIACGTGICGVTAIMATSPVIKAKDDEISYAVANITIFGLISMLFYPYIANYFFGDNPVKVGLFLGTAIHDTAQVAGAALIYNETFKIDRVVEVATVTKLTRNLFIIAVIPLISFLFYKNNLNGTKQEQYTIPKWYQFIPLFVVGFLLLALVRTGGDLMAVQNGRVYYFFTANQWEKFYSEVSTFASIYFLGGAMASVGLSTNLKMFKGLGIKPFFIGFIAAFSVSIVSFILIALFGQFISI